MKIVKIAGVVLLGLMLSAQAYYKADPTPGRAWWWGATPNRSGDSHITWNDYDTQDWRGADKLRYMNPSTGSTDPKYNDYCHPYANWPTIYKTQDDSWYLNVDFCHDNEMWNGFGFVGLGSSTNCTNMVGVGSNQQWQASEKTRIFALGLDDAGTFNFANADIDAPSAARIWIRAVMHYDGATKQFSAKLYDRDGATTGRSAGDLIAELTVDMTGKSFVLNTVRIGNLAYGWEVNNHWAQDFRAMNFYYTDSPEMVLDYNGNEVRVPGETPPTAYMADPTPGRAWWWGATPNRSGASDITWNDYNTQDWRGADKLRYMNPNTGPTEPKYNDYCHPYAAWPTICKNETTSWYLNVDFCHLNMTYNAYGFVGLGHDTNCTNMVGVGSNQQWQENGKTRIFAAGVDENGTFTFANAEIDAPFGVGVWVRAMMHYDNVTRQFTAKLYDRDGVTTGRSAGDLIAELTVDMTGKVFTLNKVRIGNLAYGWEVNNHWAQDFRAMAFYYTDNPGMILDYNGNEMPGTYYDVNINGGATGRPVEPRILGQGNQPWQTYGWTETSIIQDFDAAWGEDNHRITDLKCGSFMRQGHDDGGGAGLGCSEIFLDTVQQRMTQMNATNVIFTGPVANHPTNPSFDYAGWYTARVGRMLSNVATNGYVKINYWEIGNEAGLGSVASYATWKARYLAAYNAIKALDPTLKVGPNFGRCNLPLDPALGNQSWFRYALQDTGVPMDFISYHPYHTTPVDGDDWDISDTLTYMSQSPHDSADTPGGRALADLYRPGSGIEVFGTEYGGTISAPDCGRLGFGFSLVRQLMMAHGRYGLEPLDGTNYFIFLSKGVSYPVTGRGPYGLTHIWFPDDMEGVPPGGKLRAGYYTLKLLAQAWTGDELGLLDPVASSQGQSGNGVSLASGTAPDTLQVFVTRDNTANALNLVVTNTHPTSGVGVNFNVSNFAAITGGHVWLIDGKNVDPNANFSTIFELREPADDPNADNATLIRDLGQVSPSSGSMFTYAFPAHSMTLVKLTTTPMQLSVTPNSRNVGSAAGTTTFAVDNTGGGEMAWTAQVISGGDWATITGGSSGTNAGTITVGFTQNGTGSSRTATIRVTAEGATGSPADVTVVQAGATYLPGDANRDGQVGLQDLSALATYYGQSNLTGDTWAKGDFNDDKAVNLQDLSALATYYGQSGGGADFQSDYAKAFGTTVAKDVEDESASQAGLSCGTVGLPLIAGLFLACLGLGVRIKE